jgi:hypothetical protein
MPTEPTDPRRRIILPGDDPPREAPDDRDQAPPAGASRLILPPGAEPEEPPDLPERPRLRPLEIIAMRDGDRDVLVVTDPLGVMPAPVALRIEALDLLQVLDGTLSLNELTTEVVRASKDLRAAAYVKEFVAQLDRMLMLESPRFEEVYRELRDAYHPLEIRQTALGGHAYPEDPVQLAQFLDGHFAEAESLRAAAGEPVAAADARPRALLAPHLDPRRAGATIARAYLELGPRQPAPLRVIVYGTGHSLLGETVALTRKHFETPLGRLPCDTAFVDALAQRLGDRAWRGELAHRHEHSIEFQAIYLKHRLRDHPVSLVPILCAGFHGLEAGQGAREEASVEALVVAVREVERTLGGATMHLAAVDLSHVGPRFGDPEVDERVQGEVEAHDRAALDAAARGDADGWYQAIAAHGDATRVCGWGPTYAMLRCAEPGVGRLLRYHPSREENGSMVTVAAMVWP